MARRDSDDPTRTSNESVGAALPQPPSHRLVAPLQHRDPDRYEVLGEHGRGGLGIVSRAHDKELGRDVAIKELISRGDIGEIRFLREALITARLEHPGIVPIHEAGRWPDGTPFYVMKLVAGRSLKELLAERTTVEARLELLPHVIAVADAVAYAHKRRIIHRDLKASNVIAGDFGETVVIDWGLAKDLAAADEAGHEAPYRTAPLDDLTAAGGPVGTPMYMPPEQQRGEPVDQRADVFAIGMMLWQLCSLAQVPPPDPHARDRALRRAGIDKDLVAIIRKALAPDPGDRYRDAGELAGDLKAFKAGARIAARHYSLLGVLAHWTRRHRTLAATVATAIALAIAGSLVFVTNIAAERDRADAALVAAEEQHRRAERANAELVLQNAALLMQRDPTAAAAAAGGYRGEDQVQKQMLLAEARGRGVAEAVLAPHSKVIWFLAGDAGGAIFSLSQDRRIRVTRGKTSTTLAADLLATGVHAHAAARGLLAYGRTPAGIAVLDLKTEAITPIDAGTSIEMDITPDGSRLAALDSRGKLTVWALSPALAAEQLLEQDLSDGSYVFFAGPEHLIVRESTGLRAVSLGARKLGPRRAMPSLSSVHVRGPDVIIGDEAGRVTLLSRELTQLAQVQACRHRVNRTRLAARANAAAFACQDNMVGIIRYDESRGALLVTDTFATREASLDVDLDAAGAHIVVKADSNIVYVCDTQSRLVTRYEGHAGRVSFVAGPTPEFGHVLTGDINGTVRVWEVPSHAARAMVPAGKTLHGVAFSRDGKSFVTGGVNGIVRRVTVPDGDTTELRGHQDAVWRTVIAPDGQSFLSQGLDGTIRTWSPSSQNPSRIFAEHGNAVDAKYIEGGRRVASVGDDGRGLVWSPAGTDVSLLFKHPQQLPFRTIETLPHRDRVVVGDSKGAIWDVPLGGAPRQIRVADNNMITVLRASPDGSLLAVGINTGAVMVYETAGYDVVRETTLEAGIREIQFDPQQRDLLIASEDGRVRAVALSPRSRIQWDTLSISAQNIAYSGDGEMIAFVCRDGVSWFYSFSADRWVYTRDHVADVRWGQFLHDSPYVVSIDRSGAAVVRDVTRTFQERDNEKRHQD